MNLAELLQKKYEISAARGCLPPDDPQTTFRFDGFPTHELMIFEEIGKNLPTIFLAGTLESEIAKIPILNESFIMGLPERAARLLMVRAAFLAHAYIWEHWQEGQVREFIPASLAIVLLALGKRFGFAQLLNYWNYALWNWKRVDPNGPIMPENLELIQYFRGSMSEKWFVAIHIAIEAAVAPLFVAAWELGDALKAKNRTVILGCLGIIASALREMIALMRRMPEHCGTKEYFISVRPPLYGGKDENNFPNGICYKGRTPAEDVHLALPGETGAQSLIVPCLDRILGIAHESGSLSGHLHSMLYDCAFEKQKNFILAIEKRIRLSAETAILYGGGVEEKYWEIDKLLAEFRAIHFYYAMVYIQQWASKIKHPFGDKASGGSPYVPSLWKHFEETLGEHLLKEMGGSKKAFNTLIYPFVL